MFFAPKFQLRDSILRAFALAPELTAKQLCESLPSKQRPSLVAIYKELNKLVDQGILLKTKKNFHPRFTWLLQLSEISEQLYQTALSGIRQSLELPSTKAKIRWSFSNLRQMDRFWVQLIFKLLEASSSHLMYSWIPYPWFSLVDLEQDLDSMRAMRIGGYKLFAIIGGDSYLDRYGTRPWDSRVYTWSFAEGPFETLRDTYICLADDYVLSVRIDTRTTQAIHALFKSVTSAKHIDPAQIQQIFIGPSKSTITLVRNPKIAAKLRRKFVDYFG